MGGTRCWLWLLVIALLGVADGEAGRAQAQAIDPAGRPVAEVRIRGLDQVPEQLVRNQVRMEAGEPYDPDIVQQDIVRITHLGRFGAVRAVVEPQPDGSVVLTYVVEEQPLLADVQVVGNKAISDQALLERILLRAGDPVDPFLIERGKQQILAAYEEQGYFVADVTVDEELLGETGILIYRVREGPRVRIVDIRFEGNEAFTAQQLRSEIRSREYFPIFRRGELNREQLELDAARLRDFYQDRGYLDAQVGRRIELSPDQDEAIVAFLIREGPRYTVAEVRIEGAELFPDEQIRMVMPLRRGDVFSQSQLRASIEAIEAMYGELGFLETRVLAERLFHTEEPKVDLLVRIDEGEPSVVGKIAIRGNEVTKDNVILRQVRGLTPGRRFDRTGLEETRRRLRESPLFAGATVTVLGEPDDAARDVLIEVEEQNTGSLNFGAGLSSDVGVIGAIDLIQRNFDITDFPETPGEFFTGRAFRGAGQYFALTLQPGSELSRYAVTFREPYLLESDFFLDTSLFYFTRERDDDEYSEQRLGGTIGIGQRFGDVWSVALRSRVTQVDITNLDEDVPVDVVDVEGESLLTALGIAIERNTTDSVLFPTRGSKWEASLERVGALGGDFDFTRLSTEFRQFWTVDEDFFGRKTVLSGRLELGYIFEEDESPFFERFFAGGHRSFRGFDFRGVGPRGIIAGGPNAGDIGDDAVGGDFLLLTGLEYNFPLLDETLRGVVFTDMGTVQDDFGVDDWRVSVGAGVRIKIPFLGQAPFALDFAFPIVKEDDDEERLFSFDLALPLQ